MLNKMLHRISQDAVVQQVITVVAVLVEFVQVDVVQARTAIDHAVIDDEALQMQHPEQLAGLHRHAIHRHFTGVGTGHLLIPGRVARLFAGTDQTALGA
ncbi:hypothetical protein D3C84_1040800 [compost metagenome]